MFANKVGATLSGSADNCSMVSRSEFSNEQTIQYMLPNESAMILLKSVKDEFLFTDKALIFVDGDSITSPKRTIRRTDFYENPIDNVVFVTAGTMDNDVSISFKLGSTHFRIEMRKSETENAKIVTKCLQNLEVMQNRLKSKYQLDVKARTELGRTQVQVASGTNYKEFLSHADADAEKWSNRMMDTYVYISYKAAFDAILVNLEK